MVNACWFLGGKRTGTTHVCKPGCPDLYSWKRIDYFTSGQQVHKLEIGVAQWFRVSPYIYIYQKDEDRIITRYLVEPPPSLHGLAIKPRVAGTESAWKDTTRVCKSPLASIEESPAIVGPLTQIFMKVGRHDLFGKITVFFLGSQKCWSSMATSLMFSQRRCCGKKVERTSLSYPSSMGCFNMLFVVAFFPPIASHPSLSTFSKKSFMLVCFRTPAASLPSLLIPRSIDEKGFGQGMLNP